jgi:hypothetical protein
MKFRTKYKWSEKIQHNAHLQYSRLFGMRWVELQDRLWSDYKSMCGLSPIVQGVGHEEPLPPVATRSEEDEAGTTIPAAIKKLGG